MDRTVKEELKHYNSVKANAVSAFNQGELDKSLDYIHVAASIAWRHHLGLWYDNELENLLFKIGKNLQNKTLHIKKSKNCKRNAFIATNIKDTGGNPEVLRQWSKLLKSDFEEQNLYITHSYSSYTPINYSEEFLDDTALNVREFSFRDSNVKRINDLIKFLSNDSPDNVFLFIEPSDVIAIPAIYALNKKPKIIFFNHSDHSFWLGRNVIDYLIDFRDEGVKYSRCNRHINNSYVVPITTDMKPKQTTGNNWGINENSTVSVSVGSFHKVLGDDQINYFDIIGELLNEFPNHYHIFITNPPSNDVLKNYIKDNPSINDRFIIDGPYSDLSPVYGMADFLIETIPECGGVVRLEAMASKLPIVAFYNEKSPLFSDDASLPPKYLFIGSTKDEILDYSSKLIKDSELRKNVGENLYNYYLQEFSPEKIHETLYNIIKDTENPSIKKDHEGYNSDYDLDYIKIWYNNVNFEPYKRLLLQSILKDSSFSFTERSNFYFRSLENKEFKSKKLILMYAFFSIIGWNGLSILNNHLNNHNVVENNYESLFKFRNYFKLPKS